jgi:hypothetical protein
LYKVQPTNYKLQASNKGSLWYVCPYLKKSRKHIRIKVKTIFLQINTPWRKTSTMQPASTCSAARIMCQLLNSFVDVPIAKKIHPEHLTLLEKATLMVPDKPKEEILKLFK